MAKTVELPDVLILAVRPDSIKIEYGDVICDLPRSQLIISDDVEEEVLVDLVLPEWLAMDRGLI